MDFWRGCQIKHDYGDLCKGSILNVIFISLYLLKPLHHFDTDFLGGKPSSNFVLWLAWCPRRRETQYQPLCDTRGVDKLGATRGVECALEECVHWGSGIKGDGPGLVWSCVERENSKLLCAAAEKYRSKESLFHLPIFIMSDFAIPALTAEIAAPRRKE